MVVVVAVVNVEEVEDAGSTGAEAEAAWIMETEVLVVVLIGDAAVAMVAVVVEAAMVAARVEDTREVAVVVAEGEASRMPMDSRSRTTECSKFKTLQQPPLLKITHKTSFENHTKRRHLTKQQPPTYDPARKQNVA